MIADTHITVYEELCRIFRRQDRPTGSPPAQWEVYCPLWYRRMAAAGDEAAQTDPTVPPHSAYGRGGHSIQFGRAGQLFWSLGYAGLGLPNQKALYSGLRIVMALEGLEKDTIAYTDISLSRYILPPPIFRSSERTEVLRRKIDEGCCSLCPNPHPLIDWTIF